MNYIQVDIKLSEKEPYSDIITAKLNEIEFESYQETDGGLQAYIQKVHFNEELLNGAFKILDKQVDFDFTVKEIQQQNWNADWERSFDPIYINEQCIIRADFHPETDFPFDIVKVYQPFCSFVLKHHLKYYLQKQNQQLHKFHNNGSFLRLLQFLVSLYRHQTPHEHYKIYNQKYNFVYLQ